ncbi:MAG: sulfur carrier protein ThiS [Vallitalea sp.]|jgi:sulfur carrier protein|nr:sulfur carrier protein ThiS [Vallitalea sp.]
MKVNGIHVDLNENQSLYDYLISRGYDITIIAVEHNGDIVSKSKYKDVLLKEEDTIEIVSFVGGG